MRRNKSCRTWEAPFVFHCVGEILRRDHAQSQALERRRLLGNVRWVDQVDVSVRLLMDETDKKLREIIVELRHF